ncbi:MAG: mercuric reductase [Acidobacteriota bacterium]
MSEAAKPSHNDSWDRPAGSTHLVRPDDEHNRRLEARVHPAAWRNPEPADRYHLVVLGAGTAGLVTAAAAAGLGARVALVERHLMGGDCLNVGCVPSKALLRAARAAAEVRRSREFGIAAGEAAVDFPAVMERLRRIRADLSRHDSVRRFQELGVDVFLGEGRFVAPDVLEVAGKRLRFHRAVIATGARAAVPPIPGLAEAGFLTNETVFELTEQPRRLAVIGGGPIGCELAQAFARLGTAVFLFEAGARILSRDDSEAAEVVAAALRRDGLALHAGARIEKVERRGRVRRLFVAGAEDPQEVDAVLVGAGRLPNVEGLGLEAAGVDFDTRAGIRVDARLRTSNPRIFAAGDVCSQYRFTHAADAMARIVVQNALFFGRRKVTELVIPHCTYTDPELAQVGLTASEAEAAGYEPETLKLPFSEVDRAVLESETDGFVKVVLPRGSDRILGVTIVGPHAGDLLGEWILALSRGVRLSRLSGLVHPYPTLGEAARKLGDLQRRKKLTPWAKRLFHAWFRWWG